MAGVESTLFARRAPHKSMPPSPPGLPMLGHTLAYIRAPLQFLLDAGHHYGPITSLRLAWQDVYLVNEPALIEELLVGRHRECVKDKYTRDLMPITGQGLLTSEGELWQRQRRLAAPALQPKRIASYADAMLHATKQCCAAIADRDVRDVRADLSGLALAIAGRTLLGTDPSADATLIRDAIETFMQVYEDKLYSVQGLLPDGFPTPAKLRARRALERLDAVIEALITRSRAEDADTDHLLGRLLEARDEQGREMSKRQLRDEVVTMLLAGHETSAVTLTFALWLLAGHPDAASRLRAEVDAAFHNAAGPSYKPSDLPYLGAVIRETLRLYPPAYVIGREVVTGFELGGFAIAKKTQVAVSAYALHRDARWFADPERFAPERWLDPAAEALPRYAYLPFGAGPRICIGNHFAMMELAIVLAEFARCFEFERESNSELALEALVTLRPDGPVRLRFRRRASAA